MRLPYREPLEGATEFKRSDGRVSVLIQRGYLTNPVNSALVAQRLPYGARSRLRFGLGYAAKRQYDLAIKDFDEAIAQSGGGPQLGPKTLARS